MLFSNDIVVSLLFAWRVSCWCQDRVESGWQTSSWQLRPLSEIATQSPTRHFVMSSVYAQTPLRHHVLSVAAEPIGDERGKGKIGRAASDEVQVLDAIDLPEKILPQAIIEPDRRLGDAVIEDPGSGSMKRAGIIIKLRHEGHSGRPEILGGRQRAHSRLDSQAVDRSDRKNPVHVSVQDPSGGERFFHREPEADIGMAAPEDLTAVAGRHLHRESQGYGRDLGGLIQELMLADQCDVAQSQFTLPAAEHRLPIPAQVKGKPGALERAASRRQAGRRPFRRGDGAAKKTAVAVEDGDLDANLQTVQQPVPEIQARAELLNLDPRGHLGALLIEDRAGFRQLHANIKGPFPDHLGSVAEHTQKQQLERLKVPRWEGTESVRAGFGRAGNREDDECRHPSGGLC